MGSRKSRGSFWIIDFNVDYVCVRIHCQYAGTAVKGDRARQSPSSGFALLTGLPTGTERRSKR